jgi:hypothetical protein
VHLTNQQNNNTAGWWEENIFWAYTQFFWL